MSENNQQKITNTLNNLLLSIDMSENNQQKITDTLNNLCLLIVEDELRKSGEITSEKALEIYRKLLRKPTRL